MTKPNRPGRPKGTHEPPVYVRSVHVKLTEEMYVAVKAAADEDSRTVVQLVRLALKQYLEKGKG